MKVEDQKGSDLKGPTGSGVGTSNQIGFGFYGVIKLETGENTLVYTFIQNILCTVFQRNR